MHSSFVGCYNLFQHFFRYIIGLVVVVKAEYAAKIIFKFAESFWLVINPTPF